MNTPPSTLVLTGTHNELQSHRALKVLAASTFSSTHLTRTVVATAEEVKNRTTCLAKSMALSMPDGRTHIGGSANSMMRAIASLAPASGLNGITDIDAAQVDAWLQYGWTAVEVPLAAYRQAEAAGINSSVKNSVKKSIASAFGTLDNHLACNAFMVGNGVTNADIGLCAALTAAASDGLWDSTLNEAEGVDNDLAFQNVTRWYGIVTKQDFFVSAVVALVAL